MFDRTILDNSSWSLIYHPRARLEKKYREATNLRDKISALEDYMAAIPKHKGTEKLLQQLKTRQAKLRAQMVAEQTRRAAGGGGHSRFAIKKEGAAQLVILGPTGLGKSTFLSTLTNAKPEISTRPFTTVEPVPGMMKFEDIQIQLVEAPAIYRGASEGVGWGLKVLSLARNCDGLIIMVDLDDVVSFLEHPMLLKPAIVVANKMEVPEAEERLEELRRHFHNLTIMPISLKRGDGVKELPGRLFESLGIIRIYTKRPGQESTTKAMIVKLNSSVGEVAKLIHNDLYGGFKFAKVWGSSRYGGERVGISYVLHDKDVIEIHA